MSKIRALCAALLLGISLGGCSSIHREVCSDRSLEDARWLVSHTMAQLPGTELLDCFVVPKSYSAQGCAFRIDPANFEALFAARKLGPEGPPPELNTGYSIGLARRFGFEIVGTRFGGTEENSLSVHFNAARDHIVVVTRELNCHSLSEII